MTDPVSAIVLAGDRLGGSALARQQGVAAGVLVEVAGESCLSRVLAALRESPRIDGGLVVGPDRAITDADAGLAGLFSIGDFQWHEPADGPSTSAVSALARVDSYPVLLTGGDHALLTPDMVEQFCSRAARRRADFIVGVVPWKTVNASWPESKRTRLRFSEGDYCGANLFYLRTPAAAAVVAFWQQVERHRKQPWRIAQKLGLLSLLRYAARRLTLADALSLLGQRVGVSIAAVEIDDPRAAIDVDSGADRDLAEQILQHG